MRLAALWMLACALACLSVSSPSPLSVAQGDKPDQKLPEGDSGIAAQHKADRAIAKDKRVVFAEDFEAASMGAVTARWDNTKTEAVFSLDKDVPPGSSGKKSFLITRAHSGQSDTGGHIFKLLDKGYDRLFVRMYVKIDKNCAPIHHFGTCLGGSNPPKRWPVVKAGYRPDGDKSFWVDVEPGMERWKWDYYAYWHQMHKNSGQTRYWGNRFMEGSEPPVEKGKWTCIEQMIKLNTPGKTDGELALWIDGKLVSHLGPGFPRGKWVHDHFDSGNGEPFEGFDWRTSGELQLNFIWAYVYWGKEPDSGTSRIWWDDIVVATEYIGPLKG